MVTFGIVIFLESQLEEDKLCMCIAGITFLRQGHSFLGLSRNGTIEHNHK